MMLCALMAWQAWGCRRPAPPEPGPSSWGLVYGTDIGEGRSIIQAADGALVVAGLIRTGETDSFDALALRLDPYGNEVWSRTFGGEKFEEATGVVETADGGLLLAAKTMSMGAGMSDALILRLDRDGEKLWHKTLGDEGRDWLSSVAAVPDGFVLAGLTDSAEGVWDAWVVRIDDSGAVLWERTLGGAQFDVAEDILVTDQGIFLAGWTSSKGMGKADFWAARLDHDGGLVWDKAYGGPNVDVAESLAAAPDGGLVLAGRTASFGAGDFDAWIVKIDEHGEKQWDRTYGDRNTNGVKSIAAFGDGYILVGGTGSLINDRMDAWALRIDAAGDVVWERTFGGPGVDGAWSVAATADNGIAITGTTRINERDFRVWVLKLDPDGGCSGPGCPAADPAARPRWPHSPDARR